MFSLCLVKRNPVKSLSKYFQATAAFSSTSTFSFDSNRPTLAYDLVGDSNTSKRAVFLHGILGSKRNWRSASLTFQKTQPDFRCLSVDTRAHGLSKHVSVGDASLQSCAHDLLHLLVRDKLSEGEKQKVGEKESLVLLAHSFSGKVALSYLQLLEQLENHNLFESGSDKTMFNINSLRPSHVFVLDSKPTPYSESFVHEVFSALNRLPRTFRREQVGAALVGEGLDSATASWLTNGCLPLERGEGHATHTWGVDVDMASALFDDFCARDLLPFLREYTGPTHIHFVRASRCDWSVSLVNDLRGLAGANKRIHFHEIEAGHNIHVDNLPGLLSLVDQQLSKN